MMTLLEAAGVSRDVLVLVPSIVDTCAICRNWQRTGPKTVTSMRVPDTFNKEVQIDLLFLQDLCDFSCNRCLHTVEFSRGDCKSRVCEHS